MTYVTDTLSEDVHVWSSDLQKSKSGIKTMAESTKEQCGEERTPRRMCGWEWLAGSTGGGSPGDVALF